jgi:protein transport protein SEC24
LKNREDPKLLGTSKVFTSVLEPMLDSQLAQESSLLQSASNFYKTFAIDCSRMQVSVDMFLFSSGYSDIATLGKKFSYFYLSVSNLIPSKANLPHYTSGQTYFYPAFNAARSEDAIKFAHEFGETLAMPLMYEAVIRVRATRGSSPFTIKGSIIDPMSLGLRMSGFHGNFFVRSTDLLAMPAVPTDQSYTIEVAIDDPIQAPFAVLQTGILHSTCTGEFDLICII